VVFDHWVHRGQVHLPASAHVDIGFGMKRVADVITATDNAKGLYCGSATSGKPLLCSVHR